MTFLIVLHVIIAIILVIAILMQSGKGGGLAEGFSSAENLLGTQTNKVMVKVTAVLTALFLVLSILLAFLSSRQERSLMKSSNTAKPVTVNVEDLFKKEATETIVIDAKESSAESDVKEPLTENKEK